MPVLECVTKNYRPADVSLMHALVRAAMTADWSACWSDLLSLEINGAA